MAVEPHTPVVGRVLRQTQATASQLLSRPSSCESKSPTSTGRTLWTEARSTTPEIQLPPARPQSAHRHRLPLSNSSPTQSPLANPVAAVPLRPSNPSRCYMQSSPPSSRCASKAASLFCNPYVRAKNSRGRTPPTCVSAKRCQAARANPCDTTESENQPHAALCVLAIPVVCPCLARPTSSSCAFPAKPYPSSLALWVDLYRSMLGDNINRRGNHGDKCRKYRKRLGRRRTQTA